MSIAEVLRERQKKARYELQNSPSSSSANPSLSILGGEGVPAEQSQGADFGGHPHILNDSPIHSSSTVTGYDTGSLNLEVLGGDGSSVPNAGGSDSRPPSPTTLLFVPMSPPTVARGGPTPALMAGASHYSPPLMPTHQLSLRSFRDNILQFPADADHAAVLSSTAYLAAEIMSLPRERDAFVARSEQERINFLRSQVFSTLCHLHYMDEENARVAANGQEEMSRLLIERRNFVNALNVANQESETARQEAATVKQELEAVKLALEEEKQKSATLTERLSREENGLRQERQRNTELSAELALNAEKNLWYLREGGGIMSEALMHYYGVEKLRIEDLAAYFDEKIPTVTDEGFNRWKSAQQGGIDAPPAP